MAKITSLTEERKIMKIKKYSIVMIKCKNMRGEVGMVLNADKRFKYPYLVETEIGLTAFKKKDLKLLIE